MTERSRTLPSLLGLLVICPSLTSGYQACVLSTREQQLAARVVVDTSLWDPDLTFRRVGNGYRIRWIRVGSVLLVSNDRPRLPDVDFQGVDFRLFELGDHLPALFVVHQVPPGKKGEDWFVQFADSLADTRNDRKTGPCVTVLPQAALSQNRPIPSHRSAELLAAIKPLVDREMAVMFRKGTRCTIEFIPPWTMERYGVGRVTCGSGRPEYFTVSVLPSERMEPGSFTMYYATAFRSGPEAVFRSLQSRSGVQSDLTISRQVNLTPRAKSRTK